MLYVRTIKFNYEGHMVYIDFFYNSFTDTIESWLYVDEIGIKQFVIGETLRPLSFDAYIHNFKIWFIHTDYFINYMNEYYN